MEARIKKLQLEEDKAKKRIGDARRQQDFIQSMKVEKQKLREEKLKHYQEMNQREEYNRKKINEERKKQKDQIARSVKERVVTNKQISSDIKVQKARIRQSIEMGKLQLQEEK